MEKKSKRDEDCIVISRKEFEDKLLDREREAQIEVLTEIFQTCYQEDSKTLELVEEKLSKLNNKVIWRRKRKLKCVVFVGEN